MPQHPAPKKKLAAAFREVNRNEPAIVAKTRAKKGEKAAQAQLAAIAFSKARRGFEHDISTHVPTTPEPVTVLGATMMIQGSSRGESAGSSHKPGGTHILGGSTLDI